MSKSLVHKVLLFLTLVAFLLAGPGGTSAYVLCIGGDGHTAIERDHAGDCGRGEGCPAPAASAPHCDDSDAHGTPCTDIEHSLSSASPRNESFPLAAATSVAILPVTLSSLGSVLNLCLWHVSPRPPAPLALHTLRSTVLRC